MFRTAGIAAIGLFTLAGITAESSAQGPPPVRSLAPIVRREQSRPQIDLPDDLGGEMSAMEMAFAMAGAALDAADEATGDDDDDTGSEQQNS